VLAAELGTGSTTGSLLLALAVGVAIGVSTTRELLAAPEELLWPENVVCGHSGR